MAARKSFWETPCPERGPGLNHAHGSSCNHGHSGDQCCDCGLTAAQWHALMDKQEDEAAAKANAANAASKACDDFRFTVSGRCATCGQVENDHPTILAIAKDGCVVDHRSISVRRLIGDDGEQWTACPRCGVQIEPRMITGSGPGGAADGIGRGVIWFRLGNRLGAIKYSVESGRLGGPDDPDTWDQRFHA